MRSCPYALILAGGGGERFWPRSGRARRKQLLRLVSEQTLLEETIDRLEGLVPHERILILTNGDQEAAVRALLPDFPAENIVAEPAKRDTAAAVPPATGCVPRPHHAPPFPVLPADHLYQKRNAVLGTPPPPLARGMCGRQPVTSSRTGTSPRRATASS